jgi:hypothetical protein
MRKFLDKLMFLVVMLATVATMAIAGDGGGIDWQSHLWTFVGAILAVVLPVIGKLLGQLLVNGIKIIKDDKVRRVVADLILWAEDKYSDQAGDKKLEIVVDLLVDKCKMSKADAEIAVRAMYQNIIGQIPKNG